MERREINLGALTAQFLKPRVSHQFLLHSIGLSRRAKSVLIADSRAARFFSNSSAFSGGCDWESFFERQHLSL